MAILQNGAEVNQYASSVVSKDTELKKINATQTEQDVTTEDLITQHHTEVATDTRKKRPHLNSKMKIKPPFTTPEKQSQNKTSTQKLHVPYTLPSCNPKHQLMQVP